MDGHIQNTIILHFLIKARTSDRLYKHIYIVTNVEIIPGIVGCVHLLGPHPSNVFPLDMLDVFGWLYQNVVQAVFTKPEYVLV